MSVNTFHKCDNLRYSRRNAQIFWCHVFVSSEVKHRALSMLWNYLDTKGHFGHSRDRSSNKILVSVLNVQNCVRFSNTSAPDLKSNQVVVFIYVNVRFWEELLHISGTWLHATHLVWVTKSAPWSFWSHSILRYFWSSKKRDFFSNGGVFFTELEVFSGQA